MRRKTPPSADPVVPKDILDRAKSAAHADRAAPARPAKCVVCGNECAPTSTEGLCWVCRRLKISAWREVDQQLPAQD
jgi:hypothetical protein